MKKLIYLLLPLSLFAVTGCENQELVKENKELKVQVAELKEQLEGCIELNKVTDELIMPEIEKLTRENEQLKKQIENQ